MEFNGRKLAEIRRRNKITQVEAAKRIGCTQAAVQSWESGKYKPTRLNIEIIADAIGCDVAELIDDFIPLPPTSKYAHLANNHMMPILLDAWIQLDVVECAQVIKYAQNLAKKKKRNARKKRV